MISIGDVALFIGHASTRKKFVQRFRYYPGPYWAGFNTVLRGDPIPKVQLKTYNIFFSDPDFRKIYQSAGLTV